MERDKFWDDFELEAQTGVSEPIELTPEEAEELRAHVEIQADYMRTKIEGLNLKSSAIWKRIAARP